MNKKILIVEDEKSLRVALADKFTREGFEILTAENGKEGLLSALENKPDIILLDIVMPIMDGMTMTSELRKDPWGKDAHVVFLTNLSDAGRVIESLDRSVTDYLVKSDWKINDIVDMVKGRLKD